VQDWTAQNRNPHPSKERVRCLRGQVQMDSPQDVLSQQLEVWRLPQVKTYQRCDGRRM
jgi:hypothetical protein